MLKIDISKAISPRFGTYLLGIVPGLYFESSIALGQPHFAVSLISRVREIFPFGPFALLGVFLASALFIGQGFFLLAWIVELLIVSAFAIWRYAIKITLGSGWLYRWFGKLQGIPPKQNLLIRALGKAMFWGRRHNFSFEARPILKCLYIATKQLLKTQYGIERTFNRDDSEWGVWYAVLGKPLKDFGEASMFAKTFLGTGLAGLTALYALPPLRMRYFLALSLVFMFSGLFTSVNLVLWRFSPAKSSLARLRSVLLGLSELKAMTEKEGKPGEEPTATISAGSGG
ncbi:MAG TPA: hypothetical protein VGK36_14910 [Candidatus Angelobacter sp.]